MREIKFRAWDNEDKKMWKVVAISDSIWGDCEEAHIRVCGFHENPSIKETDVRMSVDYKLMQYTGVNDKNETPIYEGDIINYGAYSPSVVGFEDGIFWARLGQYPINVVYLGVEVLGNIYENPELLEVEANA